MDIERNFEDLGVDAITGMELMQLMGISPSDFNEPTRFMRFKDVIDFFREVPDKKFIINKITIGKNVDKLDHVWSYAELSKQKLAVNNEIESLLKKASIANDINDIITADDLQNQINSFKEHLNELDKQIEQYAY